MALKFIYAVSGVLFALVLLTAVQPTAAAASSALVVQQHVVLSGSYSFFNLDVNEGATISVNVTLSGPLPSQELLTMQTWMTPNFAEGTAYSSSGSQQINFTYLAPARVVEPWTFDFPIPVNATSATIVIRGTYTGSSLLWKDDNQIAPVVVSGLGFPGPSEYSLVISESGSTVVNKIVAPPSGSIHFAHNTTTFAGLPSIVSNEGNNVYLGFVVLFYQPALWDPVAWALLIIAIVFVILLSSRRVREFLPKRAPSLDRVTRPLKKLWKTLGQADSHKFLSIFIIISLLMVTLSFMAGPDPRVKVFVLASDTTTAQIKNSLQQSLGNVQILTPSDTESEFNTMATLGTVQVVVISDYNKLDVPSVQKYILNSLDLVPITIVIGSTNTSLAAYVDRLYNGTSLASGSLLLHVQTPSDVGSKVVTEDIRQVLRPNNLGLGVGVTNFLFVAATVGVLSFLLVTFGIAFLVSRFIEIGEKPLISALVEGIFYSGGVFFFIQAVYMTSSALLGWPLGLHAVTTGSSQVTVLGLFHLGAGNDPRTLAALVGFVIVAVPALWTKIDKYLAIAVGALAFFIVADPLTGGTVFFEFATLLFGGPQVGFANATLVSVKSFLSQIGSDAAGWISMNFGISTGEMFYYFGAIPLALLPKFKKSTATLVLLFCGLAVCDGVVRVAEMTAYKTGPSMVAGVLAGLLLAVAFLGVNRVEGFVRRYFPSRRQ